MASIAGIEGVPFCPLPQATKYLGPAPTVFFNFQTLFPFCNHLLDENRRGAELKHKNTNHSKEGSGVYNSYHTIIALHLEMLCGRGQSPHLKE